MTRPAAISASRPPALRGARRSPELQNTRGNTTCPGLRTASWSPPRLPRAASSASIPQMRWRCPGVLDVLTHAHRPRARVFRRQIQRRHCARRLAVPSALRRPGSCSAASRWRWSWPRSSRSRAMRLRSCASNMSAEAHVTDFEAQRARKATSKELEKPSHKRGNATKAFDQAPVRINAEYRMPVEHHNPMEPFATTAVWEGDGRITVYDKTQGPQNSRNYVAGVCEMPRDKVRVLSPYVGGAFGSGLRPQYQLPLAVLAARALKRSVRVTLTRQQMFTLGYRAAHRPGARARRRSRRQPRLVPAQRRRHDLAVRGFPAGFRTTGRACSIAAPNVELAPAARQARPEHAVRHARARAERRACMRSNARWMSSPMRPNIDPLELRLDQLLGQGPDRE